MTARNIWDHRLVEKLGEGGADTDLVLVAYFRSRTDRAMKRGEASPIRRSTVIPLLYNWPDTMK